MAVVRLAGCLGCAYRLLTPVIRLRAALLLVVLVGWVSPLLAQSHRCTVTEKVATYKGGDKKLTLRCPPDTTTTKGDGVAVARVWTPTTNADLQDAIRAVVGGDAIELQPGTVYGPVTLPAFQGDGVVTLRTAGTLPSRRLTLADVPQLATIQSTVSGVTPLNIPDGSHHWKLDGLAVTQTGGNTYGLIRIGDAEKHASLDVIAHDIELDRVVAYVTDPVTERRGIQVNGRNVLIHRCSVLNIKEPGADSQGIAGWDTPGPVTIDDCEIQGAGENVFFGGGNASIQGVMPTDVALTNNDIRKPLAWHGQSLNVKNLLEFKAMRRATVRGNRFDGNWPDGQAGWSILFTPRNQNGACSWCVVEDVLFEQNTLDHAASGINILAFDNETAPEQRPTTPTQRITIRQNLLKLDAATFGGEGRCYMLLLAPKDITIDGNTCIADGGSVLNVEGPPAEGFTFTNNYQQHNLYGFIGAGTAPGTPTIQAFFTAPTFAGNVLAECKGTPYPAGFSCVSLAEFWSLFTNPTAGDYTRKVAP